MGAGPDRFETAAETIDLFERPEPGDLRGAVGGLHKSRPAGRNRRPLHGRARCDSLPLRDVKNPIDRSEP